jgi:hypothetical protein
MPIYAIGRERESLTYSGEAYKRAVRKYLESLGYSQTTDSYIEGHFQDMVFVNSSIDPGRVFYVEAKASTVSLSQRDVCKEILSYLLQWLETPREKRFKFMIFVQEVSKRRRWDAIFGSPVDEISIQELNKLVNFHIDKLIRGRGFRKYRDIYFLLPYLKENKIQNRMIKSRSGRERRVARPVFDILDEVGSSDSKLYYVYHHGVKVSSKYPLQIDW